MSQLTLFGYTPKQIRKKAQFVETISGAIKKIVNLRTHAGATATFDILEDRPDLLRLQSGSKTVTIITTAFGRRVRL